MRPETRFKFNAYLTRVAELNGISTDDVSKKFTVEPSVTQTLMNKVQESSAFLQTINILPVAEMKGEKIGVGVSRCCCWQLVASLILLSCCRGFSPTITLPRQPRRMRGMWCSPTALLWSMSRKPVH